MPEIRPPDWKPEIRKQLAKLNLPPERESEMVEEFAQYLDDRFSVAMARGASAEEAKRAVLRELEQGDLLRAELRTIEPPAPPPAPVPGETGGSNLFSDLLQDLRYSLRVLGKNPGFTAVTIIALALGIGANSAIFSVVNTVLLRPLPYKDPDRLVMVWEDASKYGYPRDTPAVANYIDWRDQNQVFESMAAMAGRNFNLTGSGEPERLNGHQVSASFFSIMGVEPQLGRAFLPEEDRPGAANVVILTHGLWQRRFGGDPNIIGKTITLNSLPGEVVGVMPANFEFPDRENELFVPIAFTPEQMASRGNHYLNVIARLKPGVTVEQAQAEMTTIAARLAQQYPEQNTDLGAVVVSLQEQLVGDIRPALLILLGAVGFVLLVACANVANLLLARAAARQKEIAIRIALGASRMRLIRQFLTESVLLASLGGLVGLLLSLWGVNILKRFIPDDISQVQAISVDTNVLLFTLGISLLTGFVFGLAPATQASRFNINDTLKEGDRGSTTGSGNRIRGMLVVGEVAMSLALLIGAGLLINSFMRLSSVDPGFKIDNVLTMRITLPETKYPEQAQRAAFFKEAVERVKALPGVESAAVTNWIPLVRQGDSNGVSIEGRPAPEPGKEIIIVTRVVSPDYFKTMGIQLIAGRTLQESDRADSMPVIVASEEMARKHWPGEDAIGKRIKFGPPDSDVPWMQIVGVVKDVRQFGLAREVRPQMYVPYEQPVYFRPSHLVVKTRVEPLSLAGAIRSTIWEIDSDQPVSNINTMQDVLAESIARERFSMLLLGIFAAVALVLAAVGIYGVISYSVAQRTHELGIRMALGASKGAVLKLVVGQGAKLILIGVAIGLIAPFLMTKVMESLLYGISATDPLTLVTISLILIAVGVLASYVPARRATKVDPLVALRYE